MVGTTYTYTVLEDYTGDISMAVQMWTNRGSGLKRQDVTPGLQMRLHFPTNQDWFLCDKYLPYAQGGGYVISHDLVKFVVVNVDRLQFYNSEVYLSTYEGTY